MMDELTTSVPSKEWNIHLNIDRRRVKFKVDTGAQCNVISEELFNTLEGNQGNKTMLKSSKVTLTSFSGHKIKPVGQCTLLCEYKNKYHNIHFQVVKGKKIAEIIGLTTCAALSLISVNEVGVNKYQNKC